jgi:hypothetical protein
MISGILAMALLCGQVAPPAKVDTPLVVWDRSQWAYIPERIKGLGYKRASLVVSPKFCVIVSIDAVLTDKEVEKISEALPFVNYYILDRDNHRWFVSALK